MADLGDLSEFLKEGSISNLDWLEVDAEEYRKHVETLPKQNLDVVPDLEAAWMHKDESPSIYAVPNVVPVPSVAGTNQVNTMGDMSQAHGRLRAKPEEIRKTARLALMQSPDLNRFKHALVSRYDRDSLQAAREVIASVLNERGLLGKLYIDSHDFPMCSTGREQAPKFVHRYAKDAKYVVAKLDCAECSHKMKSPTGGDTCSVFHKEIQVEVPYSDALAVEVENMQKAKGKVITQTAGTKPRERVRLAMLSDGFVAQYPSPQIKPIEDVVRLMRPTVASEPVVDKRGLGIVSLMRREMLKGRGAAEVLQAMKAAYTPQLLIETRKTWEPVFKEAGLYGAVYSTQDSFEDCREGADFLSKHNPTVRAIVTGSKCGSCIYNKMSRCMMYGKPLLKDASTLYTPETVEAVRWEGRAAGRLPELKKAAEYGTNPRDQIRAMYRTAAEAKWNAGSQPTRLDHVVAFHGQSPQEAKPLIHPVVAGVSRLLNEGLYGTDLLRAMKLRYQPEVLLAAKDQIRALITAEQGLQGVFYVDPAAYDDYGKGCKEAERLHRTHMMEYAKVGSKCSGCVHQTAPGYCSVLDKKLVNEPPYYDKAAQQNQILASGTSTEIRFDQLVNNGLSMMVEYDLQNRTTSVELEPEKKTVPFEVQLGKMAKRR